MTKIPTTRSFMPKDRLTRICDGMLDTFKRHAETTATDRAIVFLSGGEDKCGGIGLLGYDDDKDAMVDLLFHLQMIFRANGKELHIVPVGRTPPGDRA
jgi:hypothetical protein